jgi:hypothetical protein
MPDPQYLRGLFRSRSRFLCGSGEWHNCCQRSPVLLKGRFERQFAVRDLTQCDVCMTEARNKFNQRAVSRTELSDAARHHVYEDLLIGDDFGSGFNEMFFHNWVSQAADEDPRREWELIARLREIGAEKLPGV